MTMTVSWQIKQKIGGDDISQAIGYSVSQHSIVTSKFTAPRSPAYLICRFTTTQLLRDINSKSFILVTAPADYGKTTLLAQLRKEHSEENYILH